jgi:hypothetical protein
LASPGYSEQQLTFGRYDQQQQLVVVSNFADQPVSFQLQLPKELTHLWNFGATPVSFVDVLTDAKLSSVPAAPTHAASLDPTSHHLQIELPAQGSMVLVRQ